MSRSAIASLAYGIYAFILGGGFVIKPNFIFGLSGIPLTKEPWIRVAGRLLCGIAVYYIVAAFKQVTDFIQWSVYLRSTTIFSFTAFLLVGWASQPGLPILLGIIDLLTAIWSQLSLRSDRRLHLIR